MIEKTFEDEVVATIKDKLKDTYTDAEIEVFVNKFKHTNMTSYLRKYDKYE